MLSNFTQPSLAHIQPLSRSSTVPLQRSHTARCRCWSRTGLLRNRQAPFQNASQTVRSRVVVVKAHASAVAEAPAISDTDAVYNALRRIMDPDFGKDIVACGFVKDLVIDRSAGSVAFRLELTTPACPIKDEFKRQAEEYVQELGWVREVSVTLDAAPRSGLVADSARPMGLRNVRHIIAVSSCKGGVGKSTVSVNLAYTLAQMGAKVGIFDADVYGPSLPLMVSPEVAIIRSEPGSNTLKPAEYEGVKLMSFGFAGQGSAIMRGPMVSGLIQQLLLTAEWGELDYLVIDFPPGTGDIQLTLCQSAALTAAVIVTTPQKLAFIDVAKGIRMFAKLAVPCVAVVENMSFFEGDDGKRYFPFGSGAGERIQRDFGLPNLMRMPIVPDLSASGDGGRPLVVSNPAGPVASSFMELGAVVVREVARMSSEQRSIVSYDAQRQLMRIAPLGEEPFWLMPAVVRRNDTSALSINEWTGVRMLRDEDIPDTIQPESITPLGNYAVQINWQGGFNQVAPFDLLQGLRHLATEAEVAIAGQSLLVPAM